MTEKTLVLGLIFLIDHDSEDGAANSDDSGSDQDFLNNAKTGEEVRMSYCCPFF